MVKTIDYAGFPHIFEQVIRHCDLDTQKTLRSLSTVAKTAVDRVYSRLLQFVAGRERLTLRTMVDNPSLTCIVPPFLSHWDGQVSSSLTLDQRAEFALTYANHILVPDCHLIALILLENDGRLDILAGRNVMLESAMLSKFLRTTATVGLIHYATSYNKQPWFRLPAVQCIQLHLRPSPNGKSCDCRRTASIAHSARLLYIWADRSPTNFCDFSRQLFTPTVEELQIFVDDIIKVSTYLKAISFMPHHPSLQVKVTYYGTVFPDTHLYSERWPEWLDCPVSLVTREPYRST